MIKIRNPNGFGSVIKIKNRPLRKPWKAIVTIGWEIKGDKAVQRKRCIGYYATKTEGMAALTDYHRGIVPDENATLQQVFDAWFKDNTWSEATERAYKAGYSHMASLSNQPLKSLRVGDLERVLDGTSEGFRHTVHVVMKGIYKYAMRHEIVQKDYSALIKTYRRSAPKEKRIFTKDEIDRLWKSNSQTANTILVGIYSGWRWNELMSFTIDEETDCMVGGSKTEAGKNRMVPIHHKIKPIINKMYRTPSYSAFRVSFDLLMKQLSMEHSIHETRHTTATLLYGQDEHLVKLILGHKDPDLTKGVYTHNNIEELRKVIESIDV